MSSLYFSMCVFSRLDVHLHTSVRIRGHGRTMAAPFEEIDQLLLAACSERLHLPLHSALACSDYKLSAYQKI